jgi:hypothetical protein
LQRKKILNDCAVSGGMKLVGKYEDRLILDRDVPDERERLRLGTNPIDNDEVGEFTLESELERFSKQLQGDKSLADIRADSAEIRKLMNQAEEDRDKLSERGVRAFDYLQTRKDSWY